MTRCGMSRPPRAAFPPVPALTTPRRVPSTGRGNTRRERVLAAASEDAQRLDSAAASFARGLQAGKDADDLVEEQLSQLSPELRDKYRQKIKDTLQSRAEELRRERAARAAKFELGKAAYARGQYPASAQLLERALDDEGPFSQLGGEIQLWLALAYNALGREEDCISVYLTLEKTHPIPSIRKQAADLRYIMEAPRLELSPDEKVQIPVLTDMEANRSRAAPVVRPRPRGERKVPKDWSEEFWDSYRPPRYLTNRYVWVASAVVAGVLAWYSAYYKDLPL